MNNCLEKGSTSLTTELKNLMCAAVFAKLGKMNFEQQKLNLDWLLLNKNLLRFNPSVAQTEMTSEDPP